MYQIEKENIRTNIFETIQLKEMDQVKLMNRTDRKFWFHIDLLQELLISIKDYYYVLEIEGKRELPYATTYYDTNKNNMFVAHHNGKLNRFKIRRRSYVLSGISFLEVKFKNNKGRTIKKRIPADFESCLFTETENKFLHDLSPFNSEDLQPSLINKFSRITLVNKNLKERCTIDLDLQFRISKEVITMDDMVVVEIKSDGKSSASPLAESMRDRRIKAAGFSKYCVGRTITDSKLKRNAFKVKIRRIEKAIPSLSNLYKIS